jgi:hypothetical protein
MKNLDQARAEAAQNLNLDLKGTNGAALSQADFFRLEDEIVRVVIASRGDYPANIVQWAENRKKGSFYGQPPASTSFPESVGIFTDEVLRQAEDINPLSEKNRGKTALGIWAVLLVFAAVFAAVLAKKTAPSE